MTSWFFDPYYQKPIISAAEQASWRCQIRVATPDDWTGISQIIAESFHAHDGFWGWAFPLLRLGIYEDLKHRLLSPAPHHVCLVAIDTSIAAKPTLVGTVELGVRFNDSWVATGRSFPYLSNLAVHPKYRRHGVASQLLIRCEKFSQEWGFEELYLHVLENNHKARQLYFKLGYQPYTSESHWNIFFFGRSRQILLQKYLNIE
ncbi:GNAT family N-acetyltransferase [Nodularia harveyana UHCC-0300]|uniref:GNAT family N-acetyltransferase n=1 Tax=Nodularia harveyana UHCC-0300 TaxID=2974287 RepID=A0ABU5UGB2_9CYAN|nr:GNAT family N-acetyltransferase [Nodularia harveyana]MEA5582165.1 GNAT family N-acetyltransferase [Nodularia harveyana UHCC-0300]